jgi:hypothetical protein
MQKLAILFCAAALSACASTNSVQPASGGSLFTLGEELPKASDVAKAAEQAPKRLYWFLGGR